VTSSEPDADLVELGVLERKDRLSMLVELRRLCRNILRAKYLLDCPSPLYDLAEPVLTELPGGALSGALGVPGTPSARA
jgi:hypothetical protein